MYIPIIFWIIGILFTYGFSYKTFDESDITARTKVSFALSAHLWFAWPFILGDDIRRVLDKD